MDDELYEAWLSSLTLVGDEAYLPGEPLAEEHAHRRYRPKARTEQERLARIRESSRNHMRRVRAQQHVMRSAS